MFGANRTWIASWSTVWSLPIIIRVNARIWLSLVLATALLPARASARTKAHIPVPCDPDYISALAAANHFLHAWQSEDHETSLIMLTNAAKQHTSEEGLQEFFSGGPKAAFEIGHGSKMRAGRYMFPITLFALEADPRKSTHPHHTQMIVTRTGKDDWAIDKLP
jgi:hypothetical protein